MTSTAPYNPPLHRLYNTELAASTPLPPSFFFFFRFISIFLFSPHFLLCIPRPKNMPLTLLPAQESDAPRIAAIHMAAFGTNAMLHAQFPTRTLRAGLQDAIVDKTIKDIRDAKTAVLVVRDCLDDLHLHREKGKGHDRDQNQGQGQGQKQNENEKGQEQEKESNSSNNNSVISYARWNLPVHQSEGYVEPPWCFPEGTKWDVLKMWTDKVEGAQERVLGKEPCYRK